MSGGWGHQVCALGSWTDGAAVHENRQLGMCQVQGPKSESGWINGQDVDLGVGFRKLEIVIQDPGYSFFNELRYERTDLPPEALGGPARRLRRKNDLLAKKTGAMLFW